MFPQLPLDGLDIDDDTLNVFNDLGLHNVEDLLAVPQTELINRYGRDFEGVVRALRQKGDRLLTPNVKESSVAWSYELDHAVEDFEQLIFILNHGIDALFRRVAYYGLSTEHLDISFRLSNKTTRDYEIKTSFPTPRKIVLA
jgi:nucleotidyltransferase/DNA polymerase involved in DNA repair